MTIVLAISVLALMALFLGLRVVLGKDNEVRKPGCSNANAFMDSHEKCPVCGVQSSKDCSQS